MELSCLRICGRRYRVQSIALAFIVAFLLFLTSVAIAQTAVRNTAYVAPPAGVVNTNPSPSCTSGVCSAEDTDSVAPSSDLSLVKTSISPSQAVGQTVTFTLTIGNAGPSPVAGATFIDIVPSEFTAVAVQSITGSTTATVTGNTVRGTSSLVVGATSSVVIRAVAASAGNYNNTATVSPPVGALDPVPNNNTGSQSGVILVADVSVSLDLPASAVAGTIVSGTVVFSNNGSVTDGTSTTASAVVGTVTLSNGDVLSYSMGDLEPGASVTQTFTTTVPASGSVLEATSTVATNTPETTLANNTAVASTALTPLADVAVTLSASAQGTPGSTITATVTFSNNGPSAADNASGTLVRPDGTTQTVVLGSLPSGSSTVTVVSYTVPAGSTTVQSWSAQISTSTADSNAANNTAVASTALTPLADVAVTVGPIPGGAAGSTVTATVTLSNAGNATTSFTTTISINGDVTTVAATLAPGQSLDVVITVPITATGATVTATVTGSSLPDSNPANDTDSAVALVLVPDASVSGLVYYDLNRDRVFTPGEQPLPGYRVELLQVQGTATVLVGSATTAADGRYLIAGQLPGSGYELRFKDPLGNVILGTPFNQSATTEDGNVSTGTNVLLAAVSPSDPVTVAGLIDNITLYPGDNTIEQNLPLDPSGVIYDSVTRVPVGGATVQIGGPTGFDPAIHLLGGSNTQVTETSTGGYQFLFVNSPPNGVYTLAVTPPAGYSASNAILGGVAVPSGTLVVPSGIVNVQPQFGPPAVGVNGLPGTLYYFSLDYNFVTRPGEVFNNHIPLDPQANGALIVTKVADKTVAELGDSLRYTIRVINPGTGEAPDVRVEDSLPAGFRYIPGTARLGSAVLPDPSGSAGRSLVFRIGSVAGGSEVALSYFVRLGVGSQQGDGVNRAAAVYDSPTGTVRSATAAFQVKVQGGVFATEGCIVGKVYVDCDGNHVQQNVGGARELGIPGVRLVMLDGSYVITDSEGKYSLCGVKSQTQVIKLDRKTLPLGSRMLPSSNRNAGDGNSLFVDMKGGEMARADFIEGSCSVEVLDQVKARRAQGGVFAPETEKGLDFRIQPGGELPMQQIMPAVRQDGRALP